MQFSIGDKIVHPSHGPGRIVDVERMEFMEGEKKYYTIDIPTRDMTLHMPARRATELGLRAAMSKAQLAHVVDRLGSKPRQLPQDYKERQETIWEKIKVAQPIPTAEAVRDLTWRKHRDHLTKKDTELLQRGQDFLAAEMALVLGTDISEAIEIITSALAAGMVTMAEREGPQQHLVAVSH